MPEVIARIPTEDPTPSRDLNAKDSRDIRALLGRTMISQGLRISRILVILPLLTRAELGIYTYVTTIISYLVHLHLGAFNLHLLRYPELAAAGRQTEATTLERMAWQVSIAGFTIAFLLLCAVLSGLNRWAWPIVLAFAALGALNVPWKHIANTFTATQQFRSFAKIDAVTGVIGFVLALAGALSFGLSGFLAAALLAPFLRIVLAGPLRTPQHRLPLEFHLMRRSFLPGIRLWWNNVITAIRTGLDVVILRHLIASGTVFGLYAFGNILVVSFGLLGNGLVQVQAVHLARMVGQTGDIGSPAVRQQMERSLLRDYLASVMLISAGAIAVAVSVPLLIPKYVPALPLVGLMLPAAALQRWITHPRKLLLMANRTTVASLCALLGIVAMVVHIGVVSWLAGGNTLAYATCTPVAAAAVGLSTLVATYRTVVGAEPAAFFVTKLTICSVPLLALCFAWCWGNPALGLAVGGLATGTLILGLFAVLFPGVASDTGKLLLRGFSGRFFPRAPRI